MNLQFLSLFFIILIIHPCVILCFKNMFKTEHVSNTYEIGLNNEIIYREDLQNLLTKFFKWVQNLLVGNDPYNLEYVSLDTENIFFRSKGFLKDLIISDITTLKIEPYIKNQTEYHNTYFSLFINSESLEILGNYDIDFNFQDEFLIDGSGQFGIATSGLNISIQMYLMTFYDQSIVVQWVRVNYDIDKIQVQFEGLYGGGPVCKLCNDILNAVLVRSLYLYKSLITTMLTILSDIYINKSLRGITMYNITDIIHHIIGE
ncbi:uncharacterized protein LOC142332300 [Lycorma delicatula]|uniref:uncharacterized protein LOC142332300 n=1 Tax=Lycorma delicatula TaxID=130591 RepID=UPI003F516B33